AHRGAAGHVRVRSRNATPDRAGVGIAQGVGGPDCGMGRADGAAGSVRCGSDSIVHNQSIMAPLWNPDSWSQRLAELEAQSGEVKEAPLRRDVRSLGMLLGEVLREQAGNELFKQVEELRQGTIRRRDSEARGQSEKAAAFDRAAIE